MPQACHGSIMNVMEHDDTSVTAHHNDHHQGSLTNDNQEGDDGTNDVTMHDEQGDAAAGSDNNDSVDVMPKHEGPITTSTRMTSDCHQWELASNNLNGSNCEEDDHRFNSSTQASSLSFIKPVEKDGKVNDGNGQLLEKFHCLPITRMARTRQTKNIPPFNKIKRMP